MLGAVVTRAVSHMMAWDDAHYAFGFAVSADDCWLALRGVRTLPLRMEQSAQSALKVCEALTAWPEVEQIYHTAWPKDHGHALWLRDAHGSNGTLFYDLTPGHTATQLLQYGMRIHEFVSKT